MNTKSFRSRQVRWAQKHSYYHFRIDYRQDKANVAANALFCYPQKKPGQKKKPLKEEHPDSILFANLIDQCQPFRPYAIKRTLSLIPTILYLCTRNLRLTLVAPILEYIPIQIGQ